VSLSRNKFHCNSILRANSFPVTEDYLFLPTNNWFLDKKPSIGELVIAKLNGEASSIGLTKDNIFYFEDSKELFIQSLSKAYKQPVIVQPFISGYEVEVPVISDGDICEVVLPVGISVNNKKQLNNVILDYNTRKNLEFGFYNFEKLNPTVSASIEKCTKEIVKLLGIEGFGRVDFRIDLNGNYFITDVATNPHLTKGMSFNFAFEENGMD
jgi:D-alanine-D-alanine ligase